MSVNLEFEALLVSRRVDHHRSAGEIERDHALPDELADTGRNVSDENPGADLQEPAAQVTPQTRRHRGQHDDSQKGSFS